MWWWCGGGGRGGGGDTQFLKTFCMNFFLLVMRIIWVHYWSHELAHSNLLMDRISRQKSGSWYYSTQIWLISQMTAHRKITRQVNTQWDLWNPGSTVDLCFVRFYFIVYLLLVCLCVCVCVCVCMRACLCEICLFELSVLMIYEILNKQL